MKVAVIQDSANNNHYLKYLKAFAKGIDDNVDIVNSRLAHKYDCAIIFGSYKSKRGKPAHRGKGNIIESGMPYVQLETQLIGRPITTALHNEFRVGVNGFLWDDAKWGFEYITEDRATKVFQRNGFDPNIAWRTDGNDILVCMQKVGDASLRGANIFEWTRNTVIKLREQTNRKIIIRPHPLYRKGYAHGLLKNELLQLENVHWQESDVKQKNFLSIQEQLENIWCVVSYTSGTGIDAVLHGVSNIACNAGSMVYDVSSKSLNDINNPYRDDKSLWANKIAHCQWSLEEFESGECWEHIKKSL
tara:strand:+ start:32 stop:940 length:909 start_codon:yes stop_codon:yes gene_type:complete